MNRILRTLLVAALVIVVPAASSVAQTRPSPAQMQAAMTDPQIRARILELTGAEIGVLVSDSFGRAWRLGTTDVALGVAGITALLDLDGRRDSVGYELHATQIAVADAIEGAAQLVMGKLDGIPAAIVRGLRLRGNGRASDLLMPRERDLFR